MVDHARLQALIEAAITEQVPEGIPAEIWEADEEELPSEYAMWSALTNLSQEVRLQGRAFKNLEDTLLPLKESLQNQDQALSLARETADKAFEAAQRRLHEARLEGEERARAEFLLTLMDAHDRLSLSHQSAQATRAALPQGRRWWWGGLRELRGAREAVDSLLEGSRLSLAGISALLERHQVLPIICAGQPFDPNTMNAIAVEENRSQPDGTVVEVLKAGYVCKGQLIRAAQVKVARNPKGENP
ncbi:nucleotide exchange factor GrpE [bacterium]|nr:nucleotide exchange factor GrpE [bacterium]